MQDAGYRSWVLGLQNGALVSGCGAFLRSGKLTRTLEIHSAPVLSGAAAFWDGLLEFCRSQRVTHLEVGSFGASGAFVPELPGEQHRVRRWECVVDLAGADLWESLHSKHKQGINRAKKTGVIVRAGCGERDCDEHEQLMHASTQRRQTRGEDIADPSGAAQRRLLVRHGAGQFFQALLGEKVVSSTLILLSATTGYCHTAGTSPEGMQCGASHLLNYEIARTLQQRAMTVYNLGGVQDLDSGLAKFKLRFGARIVELEAADFLVGSRLVEGLSKAARWLRESQLFHVAE
jgi:lipid II:glycine glycyltransferase (peptidoglycan interpeptide bridge formation enzyme)